MTPSDELDRLLPAAVDGQLSDTEQLHLAALLRDDPAAQAQYLDYVLLDAALRWEPPAIAARPRRSVWAVVRRASVALAACLVVAAGLALALGLSGGRAEAGPDLIERLADWNLVIAAAPTPADRQENYREQADAFAAELARADVPADDRDLASALLETARELSTQTDPLDEAEQLDRVAERMHEWLGTRAVSDKRRAALDRHYLRFVERSQHDLQKTAARPVVDEAQKKRMKHLHDRIGKRTGVRVHRESEKSRHKRKR